MPSSIDGASGSRARWITSTADGEAGAGAAGTGASSVGAAGAGDAAATAAGPGGCAGAGVRAAGGAELIIDPQCLHLIAAS